MMKLLVRKNNSSLMKVNNSLNKNEKTNKIK